MQIVMTSAIGKFTFDAGTTRTLAKLVRDAVTGEVLAPKQRGMVVHTEEDATKFVRAYESDLVSRVQFKVEFNDSVEGVLIERLAANVGGLADQARTTLALSRYRARNKKSVLEG